MAGNLLRNLEDMTALLPLPPAKSPAVRPSTAYGQRMDNRYGLTAAGVPGLCDGLCTAVSGAPERLPMWSVPALNNRTSTTDATSGGSSKAPAAPPAAAAIPASAEGGRTDSTKRSHTKSSGGKKRKKKRETLPEGFEQWPEDDQKYYQEISALLRDSKATRKQCRYTRERIGAWKTLKLRWANHPTHSIEMSAYKKALKEVKPLEKTDTLDVDF